MGKLILCRGRLTDRPYVLPITGYRIYSIEELCYYIYNNIYFINENLFTDLLIDWIKTELCLPERAKKLKSLQRERADLKSLITVVLCSADYYTEQEIKKLLAAVDEIRSMPLAKRWYKKANSYLLKKQYGQAAMEYERLLISDEAVNLSPKDYGDLLHNLALARLHINGPERASELFLHAYERNQRQESLIQYLYCIWLCKGREAFNEKILEYKVDVDLRDKIVLKMEQLSREAKLCKSMNEIDSLRRLKNTQEESALEERFRKIIDGWINEIRRM